MTLTFLIVTLYYFAWIYLKSSLGSLLEIKFIPQMAGLPTIRQNFTDHVINFWPCWLKNFFSFDSVISGDHGVKFDTENEKVFEAVDEIDFKVITDDIYGSEIVWIGTLDSWRENS